MLGQDRAIRPEDGAVVGSDAKLDRSNIHAGSPKHFNHVRLKDDAAATAVEIVGGAR
jgi:hypothetical protein